MALSRTAARLMNRLLLDRRVDAVEIITASSAHGTGGVRSGVGVPVVRAVLTAGDARTVHVREVLGLASGDCLRCGVVGGGVDDYATVAWLDDATGEGRSGEASSGTGDEASSGTGGCTGGRRLAITATAACLNFPGPWPQATGGIVTSNNDNNNNGTASSLPWRRPRVDVVLAMPAPRLMARLIPLISSLGVDRLMLTGAAKVDPAFLGSHLLQPGHPTGPAQLRLLLRKGLEQAGHATVLPRTAMRRTLAAALAALDRPDTFSDPLDFDGEGPAADDATGEGLAIAAKLDGVGFDCGDDRSLDGWGGWSGGWDELRVVAHPSGAHVPRALDPRVASFAAHGPQQPELRDQPTGRAPGGAPGGAPDGAPDEAGSAGVAWGGGRRGGAELRCDSGVAFGTGNGSDHCAFATLGTAPFPSPPGPAPSRRTARPKRIVIAIGPNCGWAVPSELDLLIDRFGFAPVSLAGPVGALKTEAAIAALV